MPTKAELEATLEPLRIELRELRAFVMAVRALVIAAQNLSHGDMAELSDGDMMTLWTELHRAVRAYRESKAKAGARGVNWSA